MKISKQARRDAKQLFRSCHQGGLIDENRVRQAVGQVVSRKPRGYLGILSHFDRLLRLDFSRRSARVESAVPLSAELEGAVRTSLIRRYGPGVNIAFSHNASLLGGMRIKVGSDVYDGSIQARLKALEESF